MKKRVNVNTQKPIDSKDDNQFKRVPLDCFASPHHPLIIHIKRLQIQGKQSP